MRAVVDDERRDAEFFRAFCKSRYAELEGRVGKAAVRIDLDDGGALVAVEHRHGVRLDLAGLDGAQRALDAVDAVRFAGVALAGDDDAGERPGLHRIEAALAEDGFDPLMESGDRQGGGLRHLSSLRCADRDRLAIEHLHT